MTAKSLQDYQQSAKFSQLCGHRIAHWHEGKGKDVLFIHGFPSASWDWYQQWQTLSNDYRLHALDLLGFGLSDKPLPYQYSLAEQADIVTALLQEQKIDSVDIIAHDYGVSVAQELLARQQQGSLACHISSICFLNGGLFSESHRPLLKQKLLKSKLGTLMASFLRKGSLKSSFTRIFGANTPPSDTEIDVLWTLLRENNGHLVMPSLLSYLDERAEKRDGWVQAMQQTDIPLAFINGVEDPISGGHMLERFSELLPDKETKALPVGHYPQLEAPENVSRLFALWLANKTLS
ncbi:alpha/beta fold hydrolase [Aestuariibacter salexigens]|uniref:alpha/beta fold hydrolase n=1 Tax=Aestuariibacter salexigens TaxID=226010 RepID=UPI000410322C|nr:alpha/beta hydrolase [Aestuariibacter salexigens]